jgi:hypothetical protein
MTALDLIKQSLRLVGVIEAGGTPSASEASDALTTLNQMIASWNTETTIPYTKYSSTFAVSANTASYTIGSGQTWNADRPAQVETAYVTSGGVDYTMYGLTFKEYSEKPYKTEINTPIPSEYMYDAAYPYGNVTLWPVPSENMTCTLIMLKKIPSFASLTTAVSLPEGYEAALKYNLAVELSTEYETEPSAIVMQKAAETKARIERLNGREYDTMTFDNAVLTNKSFRYDVSSDTYL